MTGSERAEIEAASQASGTEGVPLGAAATALVSAAIARRVRTNTGKARARVYALPARKQEGT